MGLLSNFMPGESYGIPENGNPGMMQQGGFDVNGLLGNPLFQMGVGILANNNSKNTGQVLGRGAMQGIQSYQQAQQLARQQKLTDLQTQRYERDSAQLDRKNAAIDKFKVAHPEYGDAIDIEPSLAIKAAYPQLGKSAADPYYTPLSTNTGLYSFDARSGNLVPLTGADGKTLVKSTDDPYVRGAVKGAEAAATADYKVNTDIPGQILTERQVAQMANPSLGGFPRQLPSSTPMLPQAQPNVQGAFNGNPQAIQSQIMRISNPQERSNAIQAFNAQYGGNGMPQSQPSMGGGVAVPTPVDIAGQKAEAEARAKAKVELEQNNALNNQKNAQSAQKGLQTTEDMFKYLYPNGVVRDAKGRLAVPNDVPILGNSIPDRLAMTGHEYGMHNDKASNLLGARRLVNNLVLAANNGSLGAGVSNSDVDFLKSLQGITNTAQDPKDIYNAIADNEDKFSRLVNGASQGNGNILPSGSQMPAKTRKYNPKTGRIE